MAPVSLETAYYYFSITKVLVVGKTLDNATPDLSSKYRCKIVPLVGRLRKCVRARAHACARVCVCVFVVHGGKRTGD